MQQPPERITIWHRLYGAFCGAITGALLGLIVTVVSFTATGGAVNLGYVVPLAAGGFIGLILGAINPELASALTNAWP